TRRLSALFDLTAAREQRRLAPHASRHADEDERAVERVDHLRAIERQGALATLGLTDRLDRGARRQVNTSALGFRALGFSYERRVALPQRYAARDPARARATHFDVLEIQTSTS